MIISQMRNNVTPVSASFDTTPSCPIFLLHGAIRFRMWSMPVLSHIMKGHSQDLQLWERETAKQIGVSSLISGRHDGYMIINIIYHKYNTRNTHADTQTDGQTGRSDTETDRQTARHWDRQTPRQTDRDRHWDRQTHARYRKYDIWRGGGVTLIYAWDRMWKPNILIDWVIGCFKSS